ncbi:Methyltransferase type 11 [Haloterrigena turkmenica DSM 5511]|uniref:Methyltransferase type 11 n=1 Tax=Haloterrigena turkmenica (strain ATCC 51198 / DSM 5511 / JCM 9101 / NCIMB 13204 / VKM B-1734 / 4k) TaxID=543526 RepID=D2RWQ0_HALTV|nr:methyltransferase domain-containing protein [Haloterrigena turkmenica]ADB61551.1 Methyltransferase type 11 [Haloterrigena turkmenica DSM 5511]
MATDRRDRTPTADPPATDDEHAAHLERSRRVWDRWSDWYGTSESDFEPIREAAIDRLDLQRGDRVLEIGCGPGVNFERVRRDIGAEGELVAVDYSPGMLENARARIEAHGWENVRVLRADATTVEFDDPFDVALATLSLSVMPDIRRAAETVYRSLVPGGRIAVVDIRSFPSGPARVLNPLVRRFLRWYANWNPDGGVVDALATVFDECEVVDTHMAGTSYTVVCEKRDAG